jgi:hypothetical protein
MSTSYAINEDEMDPEVLTLYKAVGRAGIAAHLSTSMLEIARSTLYSWYGGVTPSPEYRQKIKTLINVANLAVADELLPTSPQLVEERFNEAIRRYLASRAPNEAESDN